MRYTLRLVGDRPTLEEAHGRLLGRPGLSVPEDFQPRAYVGGLASLQFEADDLAPVREFLACHGYAGTLKVEECWRERGRAYWARLPGRDPYP